MTVYENKDGMFFAYCDECGEECEEGGIDFRYALAVARRLGWLAEQRFERHHGEQRPYRFDRCWKCQNGIWP